jgi:hypothetical protein
VGLERLAELGKPVQRVAPAGGTPAPVFELDAARGEIAHGGAQFLPDGVDYDRNSITWAAGARGSDRQSRATL